MNKKRILFSLFIIASLCACTNTVTSVPVTGSIEDNNSPLIKFFDCKELAFVPNGWNLNALLIQQGMNENGEEYYRCNINGTRNDVNSSIFSLYYNVILSSTREITKAELIDPTLLNAEEFYPTFYEIGNSSYSLCTKNDEQQNCGLVIHKNNTVIFVRFWTEGEISSSEVENTVNSLLEGLSQRMKTMTPP